MYPMFLINKPVTAQVGAKNLMYLKYLMLKNSKKFRIYSIRNPQMLERIGAPHGFPFIELLRPIWFHIQYRTEPYDRMYQTVWNSMIC